MAGSVGSVSRALFSTRRAWSYDSRRARANHRSTCCGQHSTARLSNTRASCSLLRSTTAFHRRTELGMFSRALRSTRRLRSSSSSSCAARIQIFTDAGSATTPRARMARAFSGVLRRAASIQTSSDFGHASHPFWMNDRAAWSFPASSSRRAAAIQPGACLGLVEMTDLSRSRAFLMSLISAEEEILSDLRSVKYPLGSTTVWPLTESERWSNLRPRTVPRPSPTALRSVTAPEPDGVSSPDPRLDPPDAVVETSFSMSAFCSSVSGAGTNAANFFLFLMV
mmetsp:Transcript_22220/g.54843  ORF Transcript_22220/g.54843 Transcript_22220/m.54843 type:complete len:281 (+) Transcript_22220:1509-2351(+)